MNRRLVTALAVAASALPAGAAPEGAYTDLVLDRCSTVEVFEEGVGARLRCPGYRGITVSVLEGDLRFYVSYGADAERQCAAQQTFGPFNTLGPRIEWRLEAGRPFATILRWHLDKEGGGRESWLVVTRLDGDGVCHVAYIEGALPDANERARAEADGRARRFDCFADTPVIVARSGSDTSRLSPRAPCPRE
jgi:hypothetical protein